MSVAYLKYQDLIFVVDDTPNARHEAEYLFEEKMCPHDVISRTIKVIDVASQFNDDCHGLFEYIGQSPEYDIDVAIRLHGQWIAGGEETK